MNNILTAQFHKNRLKDLYHKFRGTEWVDVSEYTVLELDTTCNAHIYGHIHSCTQCGKECATKHRLDSNKVVCDICLSKEVGSAPETTEDGEIKKDVPISEENESVFK